MFKLGTHRFVVLLPFLGIAIKFPRMHLVWVLREVFRCIRYRCFKELFLIMRFPIEGDISTKSWLFMGIVDNWNEFCFYLKNRKNPFLQPTFFSFLGLVNIQKFGRKLPMGRNDLWCHLCQLTKGVVFCAGHHFSNPDNFCLHNGKIRMLDYGGKRTHRVVKEFGEKIVAEFNLAFNWEEEKKK